MSLFSWKVVFFLVSPHLLVFDYIREKKEAVLSLFDLLYLPPHESFFFFWVKSCFLKCFKKIKKIDTFGWLFSLWHPFPLVMLKLDLLQNSQGSILRIHIIRLVGNEETIHECLSGGEMMPSWNHGSCGWIVSSSQTLWVTREALQVYCKVALPKGLLSI